MTKKKAWILTLVGALFFFFGFFQTNIMTALMAPLEAHFQASSREISLVSAFYFYSTMLFILPAGLMLDRFSVRSLMVINISLAVVAILVFAMSTSLVGVGVARFIGGFMSAFSLVACLKLASQLLPSEKLAMASSLIITIGMIGGMLSSVLTQALTAYFGWRAALGLIACLGVVIGAILWKFLPSKSVTIFGHHLSVWESFWIVVKKWQNWSCGLCICLLNLPVAIFGALFGVNYLVQVHHISFSQAASITSMLFLGMLFGSPFFGWLAGLLQSRRLPMIMGAIVCLIFVVLFLYAPFSSVPLLFILFFAIGFTSAAQVLGYPIIADTNRSDVTATAIGFASILIMGLGYGLGLPAIGWMLEMGTYQTAFSTIPIGILIGLVLSLFIVEKKRGLL